jgi:hypothetical protein
VSIKKPRWWPGLDVTSMSIWNSFFSSLALRSNRCGRLGSFVSVAGPLRVRVFFHSKFTFFKLFYLSRWYLIGFFPVQKYGIYYKRNIKNITFLTSNSNNKKRSFLLLFTIFTGQCIFFVTQSLKESIQTRKNFRISYTVKKEVINIRNHTNKKKPIRIIIAWQHLITILMGERSNHLIGNVLLN